MQVGRYPPIVARRISCVQVAATWDMQRVPLSHKHQTRVPIRPVKPLWDVAAEPTHLQRTPNSAPLIPSNGCPIPFPTRSPRQTTSDLVARSRRPIRVQKASGRNESRSHPRVSSPPFSGVAEVAAVPTAVPSGAPSGERPRFRISTNTGAKRPHHDLLSPQNVSFQSATVPEQLHRLRAPQPPGSAAATERQSGMGTYSSRGAQTAEAIPTILFGMLSRISGSHPCQL